MTDSAGTPEEPEDSSGRERADGAPRAGDPAPGGAPSGGRSSKAGASKAGASDAEAADAGASDTGASDAGASDAGASDVGASDAAPEDAASGKAAPEDSGPSDRDVVDGAAAATASSAGDDSRGDAATGDGSESAPHGRWRPWLRRTALVASVAVLVAAGASWMIYQKLEGNITTDTGTAEELKRYEAERPAPMVHDARNVLLIGSDNRGDGNSKYGRDNGTQRSDTTILLHLAADRKSATGVSIPRDLMVDVPACRKPDGSRTKPQFAQFNSAFEVAGPACTIRTVENLTGIRVDHHMIVDFTGFKRMVNAVHGVEVCLKDPVDDREAHLKLPAGRQKLNGEQALGYVRARYSIGNGSDTERMDRQQQFLGALVKKVQSNGVLLNPARLYPVLDAATSSLTTDSGLDSLRELYDLARSLRKIPTDRVQFLTVPRRAYSLNANRDELVQPDAAQLFNLLRNDLPVSVAPKRREAGATPSSRPDNRPGTMTGDQRTARPGAEPTDPAPTYRGTTAANGMCG
ncbi:LCP family protein [Streptomyces sp. NPDC002055]|uniref:LCP family protein n=1 Tax=Streptomyces sp. NPDC002055 TaxID=3154534 RepID=UPI003333E02B